GDHHIKQVGVAIGFGQGLEPDVGQQHIAHVGIAEYAGRTGAINRDRADSEAAADVGAVLAQVTQVRSRGNAVDRGFRLSAEVGALSRVPTAAPKNQLDVDLIDDGA